MVGKNIKSLIMLLQDNMEETAVLYLEDEENLVGEAKFILGMALDIAEELFISRNIPVDYLEHTDEMDVEVTLEGWQEYFITTRYCVVE